MPAAALAVLRELDALDPDALSPRDAHAALVRLKAQLESLASATGA
jgi:hypothetical protein